MEAQGGEDERRLSGTRDSGWRGLSAVDLTRRRGQREESGGPSTRKVQAGELRRPREAGVSEGQPVTVQSTHWGAE